MDFPPGAFWRGITFRSISGTAKLTPIKMSEEIEVKGLIVKQPAGLECVERDHHQDYGYDENVLAEMKMPNTRRYRWRSRNRPEWSVKYRKRGRCRIPVLLAVVLWWSGGLQADMLRLE
ncbi:MAG: hypothetical protein U0903_03565 [Planctomycetales bacterium]